MNTYKTAEQAAQELNGAIDEVRDRLLGVLRKARRLTEGQGAQQKDVDDQG